MPLTLAVAYLECAKGEGPGGLGDGSPTVGSRGKAPVGVWGRSPPEADAFFVTECLNFDVLEEKISKTAKNTIIKNYGRLKGGQAQGPPKYATGH